VSRNTRIAVRSELWLGGATVVYHTSESARSADLDADGDLDDLVLQVYDLAAQVERNTGLAGFGDDPLFATDTWVLPVVESVQGMSDLNGDGDVDDAVFFTFDVGSASAASLGLASAYSNSSAGSGRFLLVAEEVPGLNENGDGDLDDAIPVLYDPLTRLTTSTRTAIRPAPPRPAFFGDELAAFQADELAQGSDLDGDGNTFGHVVQIVDLASGVTTNVALDSIRITGSPEDLLVERLESAAGQDWNGDGDELDQVLHTSP
jgi:hypothetical protein